jgi:SAM-dependent methyltransferase
MNDRLQPRPTQASYILLRTLAAQLRRELVARFAGRSDLEIVDVGCGQRPYEPLFASYAARYVGVDVAPGPGTDVVASGESLPFGEGTFDGALCSQVLEHVENPGAVLSELHRVLRPGGVAFVSTHGTIRYHATLDRRPDDFWRWTHAGLQLQVASAARWEEIIVRPNGGTASALAFLLGREVEIAFRQVRARPVAAGLVAVMNAVAWRVDRAVAAAYPGRPPDLAPNYLAVAVK